MNKIGEVALILNEKFALIKTTQPLILGSEISVFKDVALSPENISKVGTQSVQIPKGKLIVLMMQSDNVYLASTITKRAAKASPANTELAKSLSLYNTIFSKAEKEIDNSGSETAEYSAKLDKSRSMNITMHTLVVPGDSVGFQA